MFNIIVALVVVVVLVSVVVAVLVARIAAGYRRTYRLMSETEQYKAAGRHVTTRAYALEGTTQVLFTIAGVGTIVTIAMIVGHIL